MPAFGQPRCSLGQRLLPTLSGRSRKCDCVLAGHLLFAPFGVWKAYSPADRSREAGGMRYAKCGRFLRAPGELIAAGSAFLVAR